MGHFVYIKTHSVFDPMYCISSAGKKMLFLLLHPFIL